MVASTMHSFHDSDAKDYHIHVYVKKRVALSYVVSL
jgi:hypothetical protein